MIGNLITRTILLSILLAVFVGVDLFLHSKGFVMEALSGGEFVERSLVESIKYLKDGYKDSVDVFEIQGKYYPMKLDSDGYQVVKYGGNNYFVYGDAGEEYVDLDDNGVPVGEDEEGSQTAPIASKTHLELLKLNSVTWKFKIPFILIGLLLLGLVKDLFGAMGSRETKPATSQKAREKHRKKLVAQIESYVKTGKHKKLIEVMSNPTTRELIAKGMDRFELPLGQAYLDTGDAEKGVQCLRRYANKFKDDEEVDLLLGEYFFENKNQARIQDLRFLLAYVEQTEDEDFLRFVAQMAIRHKANDRKTIKGLTKICSTRASSPELRDYVLQSLMQYEQMDEVAMEFYEACKAAEPENPKPVLMLAEAKLSSGQFDQAMDELESLLNMDYENQRVHDMLFTIYQLKEQLNDLYQIYQSILEDYEDEPIAIAMQRKIKADPSFNQEMADANANLSLAELLAKRKDGDSSADTSILKKYEKRLTIMFTDIKGYTAMTESQSVVETMAILQESDEIQLPIIAKHEGVVIKKIGDAFMARFDTADSAIMASVQIQQAIYQNNVQRKEAGKFEWRIRVGLNTGDVIVKDGDVFGDAVNVASRVESSSEADQVWCTGDTCEAVSNKKIKFEKKDVKKVKGKAEAIELFGVVFDPAGTGI